MMVIGSHTEMEIGEVMEHITDTDGKVYHQPAKVMATATYEEWLEQYVEDCGHPPSAWMMNEAKTHGKFYKVHTD